MHKTMDDHVCHILHPLRCRKLHTSRRDAFKPVGGEVLGEVDVVARTVTPHFTAPVAQKRFTPTFLREELKVGLAKAHPQMFAEELSAYKKFDGLVLEGTGMGHFPVNEIDKVTKEHRRIAQALKRLGGRIPVVMCSQTIFGRVMMNVYSTGRVLQQMGVIGNLSDMTPEVSYIKLAWLLSNYPEQVREFFTKNFAGELSERSVIKAEAVTPAVTPV